ncbi:MAG TPA: AraC family transcriptional regulator [Planctomycetes bacterium]|nr:AraC family transcriptional regulator [Planctomycetota bacterium]
MPSTRPEGFAGQRLVVVPPPAVAEALRRAPTGELLPTDCGLFPAAVGHERRRPRGCDQLILIACLRGHGWVELAGRRHAVGAGRLVAIPPGEAHAYGADAEHPWTILWIHLAGRQVHPWLARLGLTSTAPLRDLPNSEVVAARFEAVLSALERGVAGDDLLLAAGAAWHLLATLAAAGRGAQRGIDAALDLMRERLDGHLPVVELAAVAGLSPSRFAARFRTQVGCPPLEYHLRLRLRRAAALLESGDASIASVAAAVGYTDPFYFSRRFRAVYGLSPSAWRAQRV